MITVRLYDLRLQAVIGSAAALPPAKKRRMDDIIVPAGGTEHLVVPPGYGASAATPAAGTTGKLSFSLGGSSALQVRRMPMARYGGVRLRCRLKLSTRVRDMVGSGQEHRRAACAGSSSRI